MSHGLKFSTPSATEVCCRMFEPVTFKVSAVLVSQAHDLQCLNSSRSLALPCWRSGRISSCLPYRLAVSMLGFGGTQHSPTPGLQPHFEAADIKGSACSVSSLLIKHKLLLISTSLTCSTLSKHQSKMRFTLAAIAAAIAMVSCQTNCAINPDGCPKNGPSGQMGNLFLSSIFSNC